MVNKSRVLPCKTALLVIALLAGLCCQAKDKTQKQPDLSKTIQTILNWGQGNMNTPGAKFELRPGEPFKKDGVVYETFVPYTNGLPADQSYALFQWPINQSEPSVLYPEVYIAPNGRLCLRAGQCHDDVGPYVQLAYLPGSGEPYRNSIISRDGKSKVAQLFVPRPITGADAGCSVDVIRASPRFEAAIIRGKGFPAKAHIEYTSNSAGEMRHGPIQTDAAGNFVLVMEPFVKGKNEGTDEINFKAEGCSPTISYHWGTTTD